MARGLARKARTERIAAGRRRRHCWLDMMGDQAKTGKKETKMRVRAMGDFERTKFGVRVPLRQLYGTEADTAPHF